MLSKLFNTFNIPKEIYHSFHELSIFNALNTANIYKRNGHHAKYMFSLIFCLVFHNKNWHQLKKSKLGKELPSKDAVYRFLNASSFNWRKFLLTVSLKAHILIDKLTSHDRVSVLIVDDSPYNRARSKKTEMLSKIFDHASCSFYNGFHMLTLGWSDGATFIPVNFSLIASVKTLINNIDSTLDKRTLAYKRRKECLEKKTDLTVSMIESALHSGIHASYVLMDSWFSSASMFGRIQELGIDMIGMVKITTKQFFKYNNKPMHIKDLIKESMKYGRKQKNDKGILSSITVETMAGVKLRIVFVTNRNNRSKYIAIASSDISLSEEEIVRIYEKRWAIEVFFRNIKSTFKLEREFQSNSFDAIIAHTTIVYTRYILVAWQIRKENDVRTLGDLFLLLCDEIKETVFIEAFESLLKVVDTIKEISTVEVAEKVEDLIEQWYQMLPKWLAELLNLSRSLV